MSEAWSAEPELAWLKLRWHPSFRGGRPMAQTAATAQQLQRQKLELLVIHMNLQLEGQVRWPEQDQSRIQSLPEQDLNMS